MATELRLTLKFHRKQRKCLHCGYLEGEPVYMIETSPGQRYLVRNKAKDPKAKGFGLAVAIVPGNLEHRNLEKIRWDGPGADKGRRFTFAYLRRWVDNLRTNTANQAKWEAKDNEIFDAVARGEVVERREGCWIRLCPGTEPTENELEYEEKFSEDNLVTKSWIKKQEKYKARVAAGEELSDFAKSMAATPDPREWNTHPGNKLSRVDRSKEREKDLKLADELDELAKRFES